MRKLLVTLPLLAATLLLMAGCGKQAELEGNLLGCEATVESYTETLAECRKDITAQAEQLEYLAEEYEEAVTLLDNMSNVTGEIIMTGLVINMEEGTAETMVVTTNFPNNNTSLVIEQTAEAPIFPPQPWHIQGNEYPENTAQLNAYAHNNMVAVDAPADPTHMVVYLKEPVTHKGVNLIVYVNPVGVKRYCGARIEADITGHILSYDLSDMDVQGTSCDGNREEKFNDATEIKVGGYISTYDGNQIKYIQFE